MSQLLRTTTHSPTDGEIEMKLVGPPKPDPRYRDKVIATLERMAEHNDDEDHDG